MTDKNNQQQQNKALLPKSSGDIIYADDWNQMQVMLQNKADEDLTNTTELLAEQTAQAQAALGTQLTNAEDSLAQQITACNDALTQLETCLLYTSPSPRDQRGSRMPSSA